MLIRSLIMPLTWLSLALTATGKGAKKSPSKESGCKGPKTKNASSMWSKSTRMSVEKYEGTWTYISPCLGGSVFKAEFQCYEDEDLCIYQEEKIMQLTSPGSTEAAVVLYEDQANGLGGIAGRFVDTGCIKMAEFSPSEMFWGDALNFVSLDMAIGCDAELDGKILGFKTKIKETKEGDVMAMWWSNNDGRSFYNEDAPYPVVRQDGSLSATTGSQRKLQESYTDAATSAVSFIMDTAASACGSLDDCNAEVCGNDGCFNEVKTCSDVLDQVNDVGNEIEDAINAIPDKVVEEAVNAVQEVANGMQNAFSNWFGW
mmetsp:Transcript_10436/g.15344  ORF Transcript_10436/g.15344 Transcript_10436/m.15344 type:complete len:315 (+) Transcript_10436:135-1079(+)